MEQISTVLSFDPFECAADVLITARSHLVDRFMPDCEIVHLPPKLAGGGTLTIKTRDGTAEITRSKKRRFDWVRAKPKPMAVASKTLLDFRERVPQNWAHFLNNHLPIFFAISNKTGVKASDVLVILPGNTPGHICRAAALFGLETLCTDDPVHGAVISFRSKPWTGIRSIRADWARAPFVDQCLVRAQIRDGQQGDLPERAFISRRATRALENEAEVEAFLERHNYTKVYPEDLSVSDQFKLFERTERIVAIHGAALAPLLYRSKASRLEKLVELFPCGHMTDVYRVMSHQVGCDWIGVRGKIKPEHVAPAYDLNNPFLKFSLQSFEIDLRSLELALEMV